MNNSSNPDFNFAKVLNEEKTYKLLFPERGIGLAIVSIFEKIENRTFEDGKFTEKDLHDAFEKVNLTNERYPKEVYSEKIMNLQEYFLDYDQKTQRYFFKDYAYKFCRHAKETLIGAFNPTHIQKICSHLTETLKDSSDLQFWLENIFKKFEPDLREQIDFLDRQISLSIEDLKKKSNLSDRGFINVLIATEERLTLSQSHVTELRAAYSETKIIRAILEEKDYSNANINDLIFDVHTVIKYINDRLSSIDRKLDRIQPKIRQLFSTLNKPSFNSKIEKFILHILHSSELVEKSVVLPSKLGCPVLHIPVSNFTIVSRDKELFPSKPKERKTYSQDKKVIEENIRKVNKRLKEIDTIQKWENYILSEIELRDQINLSETFFRILDENNNSQIAVSVIFNMIKYVRNHSDSLNLVTKKVLETNLKHQNITLWKMSITKI